MKIDQTSTALKENTRFTKPLLRNVFLMPSNIACNNGTECKAHYTIGA